MSKKKHYDEASVVRSIERKPSVSVTNNGGIKVIEVLKGAQDCGCGTWGKIDYLCNVHNYRQIFVNSHSKVGKAKAFVKDSEQKVGSNKTEKRERKLNMATMSKNAMKKASNKK